MTEGLRSNLVKQLNEMKRELNALNFSQAEFDKSYAETEQELETSSMLYNKIKKVIPVQGGIIGFNIGTIFTVHPIIGGAATGLSIVTLIILLITLKKCDKRANKASGALFIKDFEKRARTAMRSGLEEEIAKLSDQVYPKEDANQPGE